jgi:AraC-like DNA-binding protein
LTIYRTYIPKPPLASFVDLFWLYEGSMLPHAKEYVLPDGSMQLVINLRDDKLRIYNSQNHDQYQSFRGSLLCGAHSRYFVIDTASQASIMGIHFKPGGAFPFFRFPAGELRDVHVSLDALWGATACDLRDQLLAASTPETRFRRLEQSLLAHVTRPLLRHPAVSFALTEFQSTPPRTNKRPVSDVSDHIGLSQRRLIQLFSDEVGLTPKLFCRVRRFQEVLRLVDKGQQLNWTDIALTCGYFDQAHFIHDFRDFSGLIPSAYLTRRGEHLNHVPLPD